MMTVEIIDRECWRMAGKPLTSGPLDYVQFAAACMAACGGPDLSADLQRWAMRRNEQPSDAEERELYRAMVRSLKRSGGRRIDAAQAQPGDVAFVSIDRQPSLGVVYRHGWVVTPGDPGWTSIPPDQIRSAWTWR
jgi:hypothetical protein